ncbi:hypothetical protein PUN28_015738 [Cardiocondyla obscurior]|uniref:Small RNA 2'-O-methyltransferase n=1 Tax=Cardiocondyla obscurior TaxID=286306 RepID=A0AAW2EZH4_9HYME
MVGLLFHVLYLLGRCIYDKYRTKKSRLLPDAAYEEMLEYENTLGDDTELEDTSWWTDKTVSCFCPPAYVQRYSAVSNVLAEYKGNLHKIVDFGCAELNFLPYLKSIKEVQQILCVDVNRQVLEMNEQKAAPLITEMLSTRQRLLVVDVYEGSVTDNDVVLESTNAVICIELIEHLYPDTLIDLPFNIFGYIKPELVIITTPNAEFNVLFPNFSGYRHPDHKFEWTRKQFQDWAHNIVVRYPYYRVTFHDICNGPEGTEKKLGPLTQMAVFHRILTKNEIAVQVLVPEEYIRLKGQSGLFNTVATYNYFMGGDSRSDEQKILDDAIYYIHFLSYNTNDAEDIPKYYEIYLDRILQFMPNCTITVDALRTILTDAGWNVVDRENGPVVLNPSEPSDDESFDDYAESNYDDQDNEYENSANDNSDNATNEEYKWDYVTELPASEMPTNENGEHLFQQSSYVENLHEESNGIYDENESYLSEQNLHSENRHTCNPINEERWDFETGSLIDEEEHSPMQFPHIENWHEELSIIIPENLSIHDENTYLFNGENSLLEESQLLNDSSVNYNGIKYSKVKNTTESVYTEENFVADCISLNKIGDLEKAQITTSNTSAELNSPRLKNSGEINPAAEPTVLHNIDQTNLTAAQEVTSMLNLQSANCSSTSPPSTYFSSSEINNSLQDFSSYYQCLLNSTFYQSEIATEATMSVKDSTVEDKHCSKKDLPTKDEEAGRSLQESELNLSLPLNYNYNVKEERNVSDINQICEDNNTADVMSSEVFSGNFNNQPKYTSSPRTKVSTANVISESVKPRKLPAMSSNILSGTTEKIDEIESDATSTSLELEFLLESDQKSNNSITETIKYLTSSDDTANTSKYDIDFIVSDSTQQQNSSLESQKLNSVGNSICTELIQDTRKLTENDIINHGSNVTNNVQNIDKDENVYCKLKKRDYEKAHLENVISDLPHSSIRKKDLNLPKELSSKSQSVNENFSFDCAKETNVLKNDKFLPCKSSEDTSNVRFTSLKSDDNVGTSKDASNATGLANNVEAKLSSPLETPPNSWSPEIMDSGYPNSGSVQDITPEYDLSSIAQDHIPDSESPSIAEAPRLGVLEPVEVENGDLANNNRDDEGNNMVAVDVNDIENLQPLINVLENDLENENDIYVMQNGFPMWLLRILDMGNPVDFDVQARQNLRLPNEIADDVNYVGNDEGFDSSSESESEVAYNEINEMGNDEFGI